jgi:hypothetical protein
LHSTQHPLGQPGLPGGQDQLGDEPGEQGELQGDGRGCNVRA